MGRSLVSCAAFPSFEFGTLKSCPFRACRVGFPIGSSCKDIDLTLPGPLVGLGTAAKEGLQPDTCACHQVLPAGVRIVQLSSRGVPGFVQKADSPF